MHLNVVRLEKSGLMENYGAEIGTLQRIVDIILENYVKTDGRFPSGLELAKDADAERPLSGRAADMIACLVKCGVLHADDEEEPVRLDQLLEMDFESEYVSRTEMELQEINDRLSLGSLGRISELLSVGQDTMD
jgi:hypothetical protein